MKKMFDIAKSQFLSSLETLTNQEWFELLEEYSKHYDPRMSDFLDAIKFEDILEEKFTHKIEQIGTLVVESYEDSKYSETFPIYGISSINNIYIPVDAQREKSPFLFFGEEYLLSQRGLEYIKSIIDGGSNTVTIKIKDKYLFGHGNYYDLVGGEWVAKY